MISPSLVRHNRPPGPANGLLGLCHLRQLQTDLVGFMRRAVEQHGDVVRYRVGPLRFYLVAHPRQISELLVKQSASLRKLRIVKRYFKRWLGDGLLLNEGGSWQQQRRKVRWAMQQVDPDMRAEMVARSTRDCLATNVGQTVDVARLMDRLAFTLNVRTFFGNEADEVIGPLYQAADDMHHIGVEELMQWNMTPDWAPTKSKAYLRAQMQTFDRLIVAQVDRRVRDSVRRPDLLSRIIGAADRQGGTVGMTAKQARDEVANLLMGGKETVGATLTWAAWLLARHPDIQDRAAAEVQQALGDRPAGARDLEKLSYTQWVVKETMRLYPAVYAISREIRRPVYVGGYRLPRGAMAQVPVYAIHRDRRWYDRPDEFDPERFRPEIAAKRPEYTYIPFGVGSRDCVGKRMGYEHCVLVVAELLRRARFSLPADVQPPTLATDIVLHPKHPLLLEVHGREDVSSAHRAHRTDSVQPEPDHEIG